MRFLDKLDLLMQNKGIKNRKELSELSGIPYTTIMNFYNRGTEKITRPTLKKLSDFFECTLDYLVDDDVLNPNDYFPIYNSYNNSSNTYKSTIEMDDGYTIDINTPVPLESLSDEERKAIYEDAMDEFYELKKSIDKKD